MEYFPLQEIGAGILLMARIRLLWEVTDLVDVFTEITINCPRDKVSEYAANPDHAPTWYVNIRSAQWQTPKPLKIGSKIAFKAQFLGNQLSYVYQIAAYIPGEMLEMKTTDGPFPMETTYTWEPSMQTQPV